MQLAKIHGKEEGSKLDPMVQEFVLQLSQLQPARSKEEEIVEAFFVGNQLKTQSSSKASGCRSATLRNSQSKSAAAGP